MVHKCCAFHSQKRCLAILFFCHLAYACSDSFPFQSHFSPSLLAQFFTLQYWRNVEAFLVVSRAGDVSGGNVVNFLWAIAVGLENYSMLSEDPPDHSSSLTPA